MTLKKKLLLNFLWFLLGMAAIVVIPLILIEQCSQPRASVDKSIPKQASHGILEYRPHAA